MGKAKALDLIDLSNTGVPKATKEDILGTAEAYLKSLGKPVIQNKLVEYTTDKVEGQAGKKRVRQLIVQRSVKQGDCEPSGTRFVYTVGEKNSHYYELPKETGQERTPFDLKCQ